MITRPTRLAAIALGLFSCAVWRPHDAVSRSADAGSPSAEERAVEYLLREVPKWRRENKCFSCHNNGDAARALYTAAQLGYQVPKQALAETTRWLEKPETWEHNGGEGPFSDKALARLQFSAALAVAIQSGSTNRRSAFTRALEDLAKDQSNEGCWLADQPDALGSPAAYGKMLGTSVARRLLADSGVDGFRGCVAKADGWLRKQPVESVMDAAAILLAIGSEPQDRSLRQRCVAILAKGQSQDDGGWGPHIRSPAENFDTALAILALQSHRDLPGVRAMIARGRKYLINNQGEDGGWGETTRPPGAESYAQRISTSGWATLALLVTSDPPSKARRQERR